MKTIDYGEHKIEVAESTFGVGEEEVFYDGILASSKRNFLGGATHMFVALENQENIQYELETGLLWHGLDTWVVIRRNGVIIFSDR